MSAFKERKSAIPNGSSVEGVINELITKNRPGMQAGENGRLGYASTGSRCLDLFSLPARANYPKRASAVIIDQITQEKRNEIVPLFVNAYKEDQKAALQVMMNYRDRTGKQEKDIPRFMMTELKRQCPITYVANLMLFVEQGYLNDLCWLFKNTMNIQNLASGIEAKIIATLIKADTDVLATNASQTTDDKRKQKQRISLIGKWAPREGQQYTEFARAIATEMFPNIQNMNKKLGMYRRACSELNKELNTFEVNMTNKDYENITIAHIPATALKKTREAIQKHMSEKYVEFMSRCRSGEIKIKTMGIQPHELYTDIVSKGSGAEQAELQLNEIIRKLRESGFFKNTLAVADVSGSMTGTPMDVSITLGYVLSQLQEGHYKNKVITFHNNPTIHTLTGETTNEKLQSLMQAPCGRNTNFIKVFDMLLRYAETNKVSEENRLEKVIVFTDMQFNSAQHNIEQYQTAYEEIKAKYESKGFTLPQIVYWNLRSTTVSLPVTKDTPGVALMNGFSSEMLKVFMESGEITPYNIMMKAISKYQVVVLEENMTNSPKPLISKNKESNTNCASGNCGNSVYPGISMTQVIVGTIAVYAIDKVIKTLSNN